MINSINDMPLIDDIWHYQEEYPVVYVPFFRRNGKKIIYYKINKEERTLDVHLFGIYDDFQIFHRSQKENDIGFQKMTINKFLEIMYKYKIKYTYSIKCYISSMGRDGKIYKIDLLWSSKAN